MGEAVGFLHQHQRGGGTGTLYSELLWASVEGGLARPDSKSFNLHRRDQIKHPRVPDAGGLLSHRFRNRETASKECGMARPCAGQEESEVDPRASSLVVTLF